MRSFVKEPINTEIFTEFFIVYLFFFVLYSVEKISAILGEEADFLDG